jgi:hypothetical protein
VYLAIVTPSALDAKEPMLSKLLAILAASRKTATRFERKLSYARKRFYSSTTAARIQRRP